jgi:hypothetical protein
MTETPVTVDGRTSSRRCFRGSARAAARPVRTHTARASRRSRAGDRRRCRGGPHRCRLPLNDSPVLSDGTRVIEECDGSAHGTTTGTGRASLARASAPTFPTVVGTPKCFDFQYSNGFAKKGEGATK